MSTVNWILFFTFSIGTIATIVTTITNVRDGMRWREELRSLRDASNARKKR